MTKVKREDCKSPSKQSSGGPYDDPDDHLTPIWKFLKPFTPELWLYMVGLFLFTGFVVWMIEHSTNNQLYQGSSLTQLATALYSAFSTLTYSRGSTIESPLSEVVVVWRISMVVLGSCYTSNLASMLNAETSPSSGCSPTGPEPLHSAKLLCLFILTVGVSSLMLLISVSKSVYARHTRVRGSESPSADGDAVSAGEVGGNDPPDGNGDDGSADDDDVEAGPMQEYSMRDGSLPEVSVQVEMVGTGHEADRAL